MRKGITAGLIVCLVFMLCSCGSQTKEQLHETASQTLATEKATEDTTATETVESTAAYIEPSGVPEAVVLQDISVSENAEYDIAHDYDEISHIDDTLITMTYKGTFGTETTTCSYIYEYDPGSDLWNLLDENKDEKTRTVNFDVEAYRNKSPFTSSTNAYHNCTYIISVLGIDMENMKVELQFSVDFSSSSVQDLNDVATLELWYANTGDEVYFTIPYKRSMVVMDEMHFMLNIDEGIQFVQ